MINNDPIYDIRCAVATALRELGVQCDHKELTDGVVECLPDFFRQPLRAAEPVPCTATTATP